MPGKYGHENAVLWIGLITLPHRALVVFVDNPSTSGVVDDKVPRILQIARKGSSPLGSPLPNQIMRDNFGRSPDHMLVGRWLICGDVRDHHVVYDAPFAIAIQ